MTQPPYTPDLAPSEFWLFSCLKRSLGTYSDATSLAKAIAKELNSIPLQEYQKTFKKWIERMKLCIEHRGDYFEIYCKKIIEMFFLSIKYLKLRELIDYPMYFSF